jgi:pimeloyl-ACP methyl ester carboxylesterase
MSGQHGYAQVGPLRMYYEVHGEPVSGRVPLLLIHGGGSTIGTNFSRLIPLLTPSRQVLAVEEQGHGHTAGIERPFTLENSARDVSRLLPELGFPQVDVLGFSNGGQIGMRLAMTRPGLVRRLVVASAFYRRDGLPDEFWAGMAQATSADMPATYHEADRAINPDPAHQEELFRGDSERVKAFVDWPDSELAEITCPTLVLGADQDVPTAEHLVRLARAVPGARLLIVPGNHGNYLGELDATGPDDAWVLPALLPFLLHFLDAPGAGQGSTA